MKKNSFSLSTFLVPGIVVKRRDDGPLSSVSQVHEGGPSLQVDVKPGEIPDRPIAVIAEIPTDPGNVMAEKRTYHLRFTR